MPEEIINPEAAVQSEQAQKDADAAEAARLEALGASTRVTFNRPLTIGGVDYARSKDPQDVPDAALEADAWFVKAAKDDGWISFDEPEVATPDGNPVKVTPAAKTTARRGR